MSFSLRKQILAILIVPFLVILALMVNELVRLNSQINRYEQLLPLTDLSKAAAALVHELQQERGHTVGLIASGFEDENRLSVAAQRQLSDTVLDGFRDALGGSRAWAHNTGISEQVSLLGETISRLPDHRKAVDAGTMTVPENIAFYTGVIEDLIKLLSVTILNAGSGPVTHELLPLYHLTRAKEHAGLERAIASALLVNADRGEFSFDLFLRYRARLTGERLSLQSFNDFALPDHDERIAALNAAPESRQVREYRRVIAQLPETGQTDSVTAAQWFAAATKRIDLIRGVEEEIAERAGAEARRELATVKTSAMTLLAVIVAGLVLAVCAGVFLAMTVAAKLKSLIDITIAMAEGDLNHDIPYTANKNEFGDMARALEYFRREMGDRVLEQDREISQQSMYMEERVKEVLALSKTLDSELSEAVESVESEITTLSELAGKIMQVVTNVRSNASGMDGSAKNSLSASESVSAATEELSISVREVSSQTTRTADIASNAHELSNRMHENIGALSDAAAKVAEVVTIINDIAEQTNLLALNATIEAARAGEAGKGFAVVANEVKGLASQTGRSTTEIQGQVTDMQAATRQAVNSIGEIGETISVITEFSATAAAAVEEQVAAIQEIAQSIAGATQHVGDVSKRSAVVLSETDEIEECIMSLGDCLDSVQFAVLGLRTKVDDVVELTVKKIERRAKYRSTCDIPCEVTVDGVSVEAKLIDISMDGVGIAAEVEADLKPDHEITIQVPEIDCVLPAHVRHKGRRSLHCQFPEDTFKTDEFQRLWSKVEDAKKKETPQKPDEGGAVEPEDEAQNAAA